MVASTDNSDRATRYSTAINNAHADNLRHALASFHSRIPLAGFAPHKAILACQCTGPAFAVAVTCRSIGNNLFHERWSGNFFARTSCKTGLSRLNSATGLPP